MILRKRKISRIFFKIAQSYRSKGIDLPKKMKRMLLCLIFIFGACTAALCQGRRLMAEADLWGLSGGMAGFGVEYGISEHWSAGGAVGFGFSHFIKDVNPLESEHRQEFGDDTSIPMPADILREQIRVKYWPREMMKGPYAMAGITHGSLSGTDFRIGAGYVMHIWKSLNLYIEYSIGLKDTIPQETFPGRGLSAGVSLTFERLQ